MIWVLFYFWNTCWNRHVFNYQTYLKPFQNHDIIRLYRNNKTNKPRKKKLTTFPCNYNSYISPTGFCRVQAMFLWIQFFDWCTLFCSVVWIILYLRCGWWCCQNTILYECNIKHKLIYRCIYSKVDLVWICNTTLFCIDVTTQSRMELINIFFKYFAYW